MNDKKDRADSDLFESINDEEMQELVRLAQEESMQKEAFEEESPVRRFPKWMFWIISVVFLFSTFSFVIQSYSIPTFEFLSASARLSADPEIQIVKKAVVTVAAGDSKGTGFSIASDGRILTNAHVVEGHEQVTVDFPDNGIFLADVEAVYEQSDLALLKVKGDGLPYLELADDPEFIEGDPVIFIGNPLRFHGIANKGAILGPTQLSGWDDEVIMMNAPVYRGNSGSPVIDHDGQVIGVVFAVMEHEVYGKVGLFVPIGLFQDTAPL